MTKINFFLPILSGLVKKLWYSVVQQKVVAGEIDSLFQSIVYGLGSGLGWAIAIVMMAAIRERLQYSHIPAGLKGPGIAFIITGLMGIAFMIFSGIQL